MQVGTSFPESKDDDVAVRPNPQRQELILKGFTKSRQVSSRRILVAADVGDKYSTGGQAAARFPVELDRLEFSGDAASVTSVGEDHVLAVARC